MGRKTNVLVLAAGYGIRLHPLTVDRPKPLLEVAGRPAMDWVLEAFDHIADKGRVCAVSNSKFSCNSNVSVILDGPVAQYQFKCTTKGTQEDDTAAYAEVQRSIKSLEGRVHEDDRNEAIRRVCRASLIFPKEFKLPPIET